MTNHSGESSSNTGHRVQDSFNAFNAMLSLSAAINYDRLATSPARLTHCNHLDRWLSDVTRSMPLLSLPGPTILAWLGLIYIDKLVRHASVNTSTQRMIFMVSDRKREKEYS